MNAYDNCKTMADRKTVDKKLRERARPTMFYQTSFIIPAIKGLLAQVRSLGKPSYRRPK